MADRIDAMLKILKWPLAILALIYLPAAAQALVGQSKTMASKTHLFPAFLLGCGLYNVAWVLWFRKKIWGSAFSTLEHELTHALFGLFTFRIIRGIRISWSGGGHVRFKGAANWMIYLAPYWFPTLTLALLPAIWLVGSQQEHIANLLLGASVGFHLCSTWKEIHPRQTDLQKVGFFFSLCVLPCLNLLSYGSILAYMLGSFRGVGQFWLDILQRPTNWITVLS